MGKNKKIKKLQDGVTLKELEEKGLIPKNLHLFDSIDMKELNLKNKTDWWKKIKDKDTLK